MRPTRHDWSELVIGAVALLRIVTAVVEHRWSLALWATIALLWIVSAYMHKKTSQAWKTLYLDVKAHRDRATWGRHLS